MPFKITILGNPATKKNSQQIICRGNRPMLIQSKTYRDYRKSALKQLTSWGNYQFSGPIEITCLYFCQDNRKRDLTNLLAATQDILQDSGLILDDSQVKSVDGSRIMDKDKDNPRVEITIRSLIETLATLSELKGIAPDLTGGLSSEEFVRKQRGEWKMTECENCQRLEE